MEAVGRSFRGRSARVHLVGGSSLVWEGLKVATVDIDVDLRATPPEEHGKLIDALRATIRDLSMSVEEASPAEFIPLPTGAEQRARFIARHGSVDFFHFDFYSVALSKLDRGQERDFEDVCAMLQAGLLDRDQLERLAEEVATRLPEMGLRANPERFRRHVEELWSRWQS